MDHYQTPSQVHASVYAKQADKERSTVIFEAEKVSFSSCGQESEADGDCSQVHLDVYLPASKRFRQTLELFGPIDPSASAFKILGTKVRSRDLTLDSDG